MRTYAWSNVLMPTLFKYCARVQRQVKPCLQGGGQELVVLVPQEDALVVVDDSRVGSEQTHTDLYKSGQCVM